MTTQTTESDRLTLRGTCMECFEQIPVNDLSRLSFRVGRLCPKCRERFVGERAAQIRARAVRERRARSVRMMQERFAVRCRRNAAGIIAIIVLTVYAVLRWAGVGI